MRLEWGFHPANLYFGVGHDEYPTQHSLADGLAVEAGLTIALPESRWKRELHLSH